MAENATLVGQVVMGDQCSVWFNAVVRGDVNRIEIGHRCNIQDGAVVHCTFQGASVSIGNDVSIGHNATIHGCTIHHGVLIGMGAIVMDHAVVESGAMVAAGAVVLEGTHIKTGELYAGVPAKKVKDLSPDQAERFAQTANKYIKYSGWFSQPHTDPEAPANT